MKGKFLLFLSIILFFNKLVCQIPCEFNTFFYGNNQYSTEILDNGVVRIYSLDILGSINWGDLTTTNAQYTNQAFYHTYNTNGSYPIEFIYYDVYRNCTTQVDTQVIITTATGNPCNTIFTYTASGSQWVFTPYTITYPFIGSNMHWEFDNGQSINSNSVQIQNYNVEGDYNVCLTNTNSIIGCSSTYCDTVHINYHGGHFCNVNLLIEQEDNFVKVIYNTEDSLYNLMLTDINYGDGSPSDGQLSHRYTTTGSFTISLDFNNSTSPWMCDTLITQTINVTSITGPPCNAGIVMHEYSPRGNYYFENPQNLYYGANYIQSWNFGEGWLNSPNSEYTFNTFDSVGTYQICNALYVPETGCYDTVCGNYYIEHSATGEGCDIYGNYKLILKDSSNAYIVINTQTTPSYEIPYSVLLSGVEVAGGWASGYSNIIQIDPNLTHIVNMYFSPTYECYDNYSFIIDVTGDSNFPCDSIILGVDVINQGNGNFEIKPLIHPNLSDNIKLLTANYNINGYNFTADLKSLFVNIPFNGIFSGWVEFTDPNLNLVCTPSLKYYFSINNTSSSTTAICDAYFELIEDTFNLVPNTWICNNGSIGNNLSYLWNFGDGNYSDSILPNHVYSTPGYYEVTLTIIDTVSGCTDSYFSNARNNSELITQIIPGSVIIGIDENHNHKVVMYPNPANDFIYLMCDGYPFETITIYNLTGSYTNVYKNLSSIPIFEYSSGIYFINAQYADKHYTFKLVKN